MPFVVYPTVSFHDLIGNIAEPLTRIHQQGCRFHDTQSHPEVNTQQGSAVQTESDVILSVGANVLETRHAQSGWRVAIACGVEGLKVFTKLSPSNTDPVKHKTTRRGEGNKNTGQTKGLGVVRFVHIRAVRNGGVRTLQAA